MAKKTAKNKTKTAKVRAKAKGKTVKRKRKGSVKHIILITLLSIAIIIASLGLAFCIYIIVSAPDFDVDELYKSNSSIIYDINGDVIAELGTEKRDNVTYDELPDVLVDAIVATEDSKFFQHSGIDLLRFAKASLGQLLGQSDAGGASTLTMQIVKNTYTGTQSSGVEGIIRKFTDIYVAVFKLEKTYTKQEILEFYVNQPYLGGGTYGVEQASQTYFGKSVSELNLSEAATIAGLFQSPDAYDPFKSPEKAEARRNTVLSLMVRHGYITQEEADIASAIPIEDLLVEQTSTTSVYQDFVDTVVAEVIENTGNNPYSVSMTIYSTMDPDIQDVVNDLYNGVTYTWVNDVVQCGLAITDVEDGSVVAVGARRNRTGVNQYNYATDISRHPGSTAKPIFDYGPAIEYAGWGTGTTVVDDTYTYSDGTSINNVDLSYIGITTAKVALAKSRNIPALQAFQATTQAQKYEFVTNLGITPELHDGEIYESSSIGAFNGVSPMQLSAAYGAFSRGGYYIEPYTYTKIVYNDTEEVDIYTPTKTKAMSEETAYMINMILKYAVTSGQIGVGSTKGDVASKTGTSSVDSSIISSLGLKSSAIGDSWQIAYSPEYSIAFWYGYDEISSDYYLTSSEGWTARRAIIRAIAPKVFTNSSAKWTKPSGVVAVDIELETNPVQLASDYTPDSLRSTEYFKSGTEPTEVSTRFAQLENVTNLTYSTSGNAITLTWTEIDTPDAINSTYLQNYFEENYSRWSAKYYQNRLDYNTKNIGTLQYTVYIKNSDGSLSSLGSTTSNTYTVTLTNASSATYVVKSNYTIFKSNASLGTEISVRLYDITETEEEEETETDEEIQTEE